MKLNGYAITESIIVEQEQQQKPQKRTGMVGGAVKGAGLLGGAALAAKGAKKLAPNLLKKLPGNVGKAVGAGAAIGAGAGLLNRAIRGKYKQPQQ